MEFGEPNTQNESTYRGKVQTTRIKSWYDIHNNSIWLQEKDLSCYIMQSVNEAAPPTIQSNCWGGGGHNTVEKRKGSMTS